MGDFEDSSFEDEFNLTIQKKFLTILIFDPDWAQLNGKDIIRPEFFENHMLHNICRWIHNYYRKYKTTPTELVLTEKARELVNDKYLSPKEYFNYQTTIKEIFEIQGSDDFEFFKDRATTFARMMAWKKALAESTNIFKENNYDVALSKFKEVLSIGGDVDLGLDFREETIDDFLSDVAEMYDRTNMVKTGVEGWDRALGGGFVRNNVHIIAACFPGYTKVKTNKGKLRLDDLATLTNYDDLRVYSFNGEEKIESEIENVFETKMTDELISLKFNNGKSIQCTPEHYFVIKNPKSDDKNIIYENGIAYKQAQYLSEEDIF